MSDKSFGDCTNRNVMKNPLLSTAVTGLSIEDLTHNAVLLPAVPSQELITTQDSQNEAQNITLRHLDHDITNFPSGDAASYQTQFKSNPYLNKSLLDNQKQTQFIKNNDNSITTKSKASLKSDDDFDVNEYFARLQGTRYVSAPLNSHLKEDQNANLPAEENLEEINLNEPEKKQNQNDFQHSLTADIAQNFSQLPSVLPQVASAVFSSFSNMLNLKSREQTPDEVKMYQHAQMPEMTVPFAVPEPQAQAVPPPLKEPPASSNTSNYRITTKKKVYAQIPGLSSGDNQMHTYNTAPVGQVPYYFTPETMVPDNRQESFHTSLDQLPQDIDRIQVKSIPGTEETFDAFSNKTADLSRGVLSEPKAIVDNELKVTKPISEFHQEIFKHEIEDTKVHENITETQVETIRCKISSSNQNIEESYIQDSLNSTEKNNEIQFSIGKSQVDLNHSSNQFVPISQVSTSIIPPPPMFSSMPRKDSQLTDKSILPPSVARRIGSNQPAIKSSTISNPILQENIFIPNLLPEFQSASGDMPTNIQQCDQQDPVYNMSIGHNRNETNTKLNPKEYFGSSNSITPGFNPFAQTVAATSQNILNESIIVPPRTTDILSITHPQKDLSKAEKENENRLPIYNIYGSPYDSNKYPSKIVDNNIVHQVVPETNIAPPMFFNPTSATLSKNGSSITDHQSQLVAQNIMPHSYTNDSAPEPPKGVPEPPKVSSSLSYRMTKKRPQYYSGPIEGLGSISNNIKPTINPVQPNVYHGALFNPDQVQSGHKLPATYDSPNQQESLAPFDISRPINLPIQSTNDSYITQNQMTQNDFNTAFDLSRPTTERHEQTQSQESKGFGIIGSLKSKLSSIDINKIQNTVTTFFDPTYNEPKTDAHKEKESNFQTFSGNYQNFPQNEGASFVPNIEQTGYQTANPYNYQMQTLQTYQNQQYYPNQEYFNQSHNYSKDFYSGCHENLNKPVVGTNISNVVAESCSENDNMEIKTQSTNLKPIFEVATSCTQAETDSIVEANRKTIDNVSQITDKSESVFDNFTLTVGAKSVENVLIAESDNQQKIGKTEMTASILEKYSASSKTDIQSPISLFKEINTDDVHNDIKKHETSNNDIIHQLKSVADSTLKNVFDCKSPVVVESVLERDLQEPFPTISNAPVDPSFTPFFDYQQPIFAIPDNNNIKQTINDHPINIDSSQTFFDFQTPINNPLPGNKDDYIILNSANTQNPTIGNTLEMLSGPTDFNSLCPLLQSRSENLQDNASALFSGKNTLNETPLFSLFEQPSLLPPLPSFDLSKLSSISLPVPMKSLKSADIKSLETKMDNVSLYDNTENNTKFERKSSFFDKTLPVEDNTIFVDNQVSDLNICETCREVNKPEEKEADLTTQLIENITAPIQLANPVEFPVIASTSVPDISEFSNQFAEISYIPEDIIETMKQPPSVEPKEDNFNSAITFGWSAGDSQPTKALTEHEYTFRTDPNVIGFFDDKSLFFENVPTNASDEIKAEYKISQDDTIVLPHQLSLPTAPPEEDSNSDESGLDVHSIEQDAKNDFPIYEEFVIEPSETDDDKIEFKERERYVEDSPQDVDTFTNRIERFKQMETSSDLPDVYEAQKASNTLTLATSSSPAITIASYFDTGNYAVENHYKNSLTSPTSVSFGTNISSPTSIPPGFEEEYKRKLSGISSKDIPIGLNVGNISFIPDTTTQTPITLCLTFTQPSNAQPTNVVTTDISAPTTSFVSETVRNKNERLPAFSSIIKPKSETVNHEDKFSLVEKTAAKTKPVNDTLSDSSNFFSSNEESNVNSDVYNNFSRLSSYFTTPPKPDHSKSFFELSQSQNHYRHKPDHIDSIQSKVKDFFDSSDLTKTKASNIPQNYLASMNLIRDLASHKTVTPKEDTVKIVNFFTVSYDIDKTNIGEPKSSIDIPEKSIGKNTDGLNELGDTDDTRICVEDLLKQCKYCYDTIKKIDIRIADSAYKVKNCMNNSENKNGESNMSSKQANVKKSVTVNFCDSTLEETNEKIVVTSESRNSSDYAPVKHHWFYRVDFEGKSIWRGFSVADSRALENAFLSPDLNETTVVATDGGRFDVNVVGRLRIPVYWIDKPSNVMRCSWFYKGNIDARYVPYGESDAEKLEEEYRHGVTTGEWHRRLMLPNNEMVVMHGPAVMVHFLQGSPTEGFGSNSLFHFGKRVYRNPPKINVACDQPIQIDHLIFLVHGAGEYRHQKEKIQSTMRPRVVRRGYVESEIEDTEPSSIDHLLLLCHGVGSACDMRFRSVEEVVDDFRTTSLQLIQSHYKNSYDSGVIGRVEVLPISWHSSLHSGETGVDRRLAAVTLESIPRLRNFTNDTILDVLFYTSPVYCQTIVNTVCRELNRIYKLFKTRNPDFKGGVSLGGHSLGSVILYDLLCHQTPENLKVSSPTKHYVSGTAGTGQPTVLYPGLVFQPDALYALGSPIAIFECIRGVETLGQDFCLPTCKKFFNIFHPYDPIAYRLEPMINPSLRDVKPSLIPHHKGRKRMHLELKDTMARVGADIKQKLIESIRNTWSSMWRTSPPPEQQLEKVVEEIEKEELTTDTKEDHSQYEATPDTLGRLNNGRRIDHVLQEAPFEIFNEYLFAMTSHVCYWESEDTMLVMLREIYNTLGVSPDSSLPQHSLTVERSRLLDDSDNPTSPADFPSTSRGTS